ncbi:protein spaetzle-like [Coccinella septempunctata]|uniref:protein spaetzle-like n=1 Tax=Coccinella septempunctata TaxID=41139 RepID=UPI001D07C411|nr:protein spaetzle-like [Coccinella septempunctata]
MRLKMKSWATFVAGFAFLVFNSRISACHPYQTHNPHDDKKRSSVREREPFVETTINWTNENHKVHVTTLDINRGYVEPIIPDYFPSPKQHKTQKKEEKPKKKCIRNFCEDVENYPETLIKNVLSRARNLEAYFKEAEVTFDISNRGGFDEDEDDSDSMCPTKSITMYPKTAINTKKEEKFLINVEGHRQGIVFQTCIENSNCRFHEGFPTDYESSCKQKYVRRSLAILGDDNQTTAWDTFEVPSCCVCVIKRKN